MSEQEIKDRIAQFQIWRRETQIFNDYVAGIQKLQYSSTEYKNKFGLRLRELVDNICGTVVNAPASRLEVINFAPESGNQELSQRAWAIWSNSKMPGLQKELYREAVLNGAAYLIVWRDAKNNTRIWPQKSPDILLFRDDDGRTLEADKLWFDASSQRYYLTRYFADRIEKYQSERQIKTAEVLSLETLRFIPREVEGESFPLMNPYGAVPVFELEMPARRSLLADVIPLQDVINKHLSDLMVAGEYNSLRQRWATGIEFEVDPKTGKAVIPFGYNDQLWASSSETGRFGEFSNTLLSDYLNALTDARNEIARITGIPLHWFNLTSGQFPSGEALRNAESRFIAMLSELQLRFGAELSEMIAFALQVEMESTAPIDEHFAVQWQSAAPVSEQEMLSNALIKKQLGVSAQRLLEELGYTQSDIEAILIQKAEEERTQAEASARFFNAGMIQ